MFSHVMVGSNDIERSKRFYDAVLGVLGAGALGILVGAVLLAVRRRRQGA